MDSIIRNLMTNALKYTCQGGNVTVQTQKNKSHWFITITDTGIGIPENKLQNIFEAFHLTIRVIFLSPVVLKR